MESVQPDNADPIPLRHSQHSVGSIAIRFIGLLLASVMRDGADLEQLIVGLVRNSAAMVTEVLQLFA